MTVLTYPRPNCLDAPVTEPMTTPERELLARAAELHRPLAKAARLGRSNGSGYVVFGVMSLVFAVLDPGPIGIALGVVLLGAGLVERAGAARLRRADPTALLRMARAELVLMGAIVIYGILGLTVLRSSGAQELQELGAQAGGMEGLGQDLRELTEAVDTLWYALIIGVALIYQGGMARAFLRRRADLARYLTEVPGWARSVVESMD